MPELEIIITQDGSHSLLSKQYAVSYHSRFGAIQESRHVFIEHGLFSKALAKPTLRILEVGFGTGLNALLTWVEAERHGWTVTFTTVEWDPVPVDLARMLNYPSQLEDKAWTSRFEAMHEAPWEETVQLSPRFSLVKHKVKAEDLSLSHPVDLIYYDAFAPSAQPELWEKPVLERMHAALEPGGVLVTYCAKGAFKRTMKELGFRVEALPGPPGKREMTRCVKENQMPEREAVLTGK